MELLDLPAEIFERIIAHIVTSIGIVGAWEHRKVCRTFRRYIEHETLANQPTRAFLRAKEESARAILRNNMALYLSYRMTALRGAYPFLPHFLKKSCDTVCLGQSEVDYHTQRQHARTLCKLLVEKQSDTWNLLIIKTPKTSIKFTEVVPLFSEDVVSNDIAAAAAVGEIQALRKALGDEPDKIWDESPVFGWPLAAAAAGNHLDIVRAIVKHFEHTQHRTHMRDHEPHFWAAIVAALDAKHSEVALLLLEVFHEYGSPVWKDRLTLWTAKAVKTRDSRVIRRVLALREAGVMTREFEDACYSGDLKTVRMFIANGFVSLHCTYSYSTIKTPITTAVESERVEVVEELLDMAADPNGCYAPTDRKRPLWIAIKDNSEDIVRVLLHHGANPGLVVELWEEQTDDFRDSRAAIKALLMQAECAQNYYVRSTAPRTHFAADAADL